MKLSLIAVFALTLVSSVAIADTSSSGALRPSAEDNYTITTQPGNRLIIAVQGDGDGDIDCQLIDSDGDVVAKDEDGEDNCAIVGWSHATSYRLRIHNSGKNKTAYTVRINSGKAPARPNSDI